MAIFPKCGWGVRFLKNARMGRCKTPNKKKDFRTLKKIQSANPGFTYAYYRWNLIGEVVADYGNMDDYV